MTNKSKLVRTVSRKTKYSKEACEVIINAFLDAIKDALVKGERLFLQNFMAFEVVEKNSQMRRNPQTGEVQMYPAHKSVRCKASQSLKTAINERVEK